MATLNKFGVPIDGATGRGGILQPKLKYRFRVRFTGFGNIGASPIDLTQQIMNVTRPKVTHEEVPVHVYNSVAYLMGKHTWEPITLNLREDVSNNVQKLVGEQLQKQFDFFEQSSAASGADYKFVTRIEILDGGNGANTAGVLETFELYGCYLESANYNQLAYATSDAVTVALTIRYDNAIQTPQGTGVGTAVGRTVNTLVTGGGSV